MKYNKIVAALLFIFFACSFCGCEQVVSKYEDPYIEHGPYEEWNTRPYPYSPELSLESILTYPETDSKYFETEEDDINNGVYITSVLFDEFDTPEVIVVPQFIKGFPVIGIDVAAFGSCRARAIVLPDSVKEVGSCSFYNDRFLEFVYFPDSLEQMGDKVFSRCESLKEVHYPSNLQSQNS